jgi:hypothetical protein
VPTRRLVTALYLSILLGVVVLGSSGYAGLRGDAASAAVLERASTALAEDRNEEAADAALEVLARRADSLAAHGILSCAQWRLGNGELALVALRGAILGGLPHGGDRASCHGSELPFVLTRVARVDDLALLHWRADDNDPQQVRAAAELDQALAADDPGRAMAAIACLNVLGGLDRLADLDHAVVELAGWSLAGVPESTWKCLS